MLLALLIGRRRFLVFPMFTAWMALNVTRTIALFFVYRVGYKPYYYAYWMFAFADMSLQLIVFYEAAVHIFRPGPEWPRDIHRASLWIIAIALVVGIALTWLGAPPSEDYRTRITIRGNFLSSVLMSELFIAMIGMSAKFRLPWRTHVARVVQGLGGYSLFGIVSSCLQTYLGFDQNGKAFKTIGQIQSGAYLICVGFWIITLYRKAPAPKSLPEKMEQQLSLMQQWVTRMLRQFR